MANARQASDSLGVDRRFGFRLSNQVKHASGLTGRG
jgi:hypothetical protein